MSQSIAAKCKTSKGQALILSTVAVEIFLVVYAIWNPDTVESRYAVNAAIDILAVPVFALGIFELAKKYNSSNDANAILNTGVLLGIAAIASFLTMVFVYEYAYVQNLTTESSASGLKDKVLANLVESLLIVFGATGIGAIGILMSWLK